jgi:RNA polymerase sigma-70 factor (ECF subfamily)
MPGTTGSEAERVIRTYSDMVYRMAYAHVRNASDADDVMQEVFLRYLRKLPRFENEEHCKRWLLRVTVNCARSFNHTAWMRYVVPLEQEVYAEPEENRLADALFRLPPKYRDIIHLYYYEGYKTEEIAGILHRKPATVRSQLARAREKLAEILKEELE